MKEKFSIKEIESQLTDEFAMFDDWMDKYNYIIEMGRALPLIDPKYKDEQHIISGCQSRVWLHADYKHGRIHFSADSDAVITKGLIFMLIRVLSGQTPQDIYGSDLAFLDEIGMKEHLSPTRSNGLMSMVKQMKLYAYAIMTKENQKTQ